MDRVLGWVDWSSAPTPVDLLSVVGIGVAVIQLIRSRSALAAAKSAYDHTRSSLTVHQVLSAIPNLREASSLLDGILHLDTHSDAARYLRRFSEGSWRLAALIEIADPTRQDLISELRALANETSEAQSSLYQGAGVGVPNQNSVGDAAASMRTLVATLHGVEASLKNTPVQTNQQRTRWWRHE